MARARWIVLSVVVLLLVAYGAYAWTTALLDSMFAYRSPLKDTPPAPVALDSAAHPLTSRVVLVVVDALRDDTSRNATVMPFLNELRQKGAWATMHSHAPSWSQTGWTVIGTGAWPDVSDGPAVNVDRLWPWTQDNIFAMAKRAGKKTAVSGFDWWGDFIRPEWRDDSFLTPGEDETADVAVLDAALPWLRSRDYALILIHLDQVDYAGHHQGGPRDPRWNAAATRADAQLKQIAGLLDFSQDTLIVISDHGQIDQGGHGGPEPITLIEPFVMAGAGVKPGRYPDVLMVDVAPTLGVLMGTGLPASSEGQPLAPMLVLDSAAQDRLPATWAQQQTALMQAYAKAIGVAPDAFHGSDAVSQIVAMQATREAGERWPRVVIAVLAALAGAALLFWRRSRDVALLTVGALIYVLLYNLAYTLAGNTYSMSSVSSGAAAFVVKLAQFVLVALIPAWLAAMLLSGAFRRGSLRAAQSTFGFALITIYLLFLPALLAFAVNGAVIAWRLPNMLLAFLHFTNLLQAALVAAVSLVLAGIAALAGRFAGRQAA